MTSSAPFASIVTLITKAKVRPNQTEAFTQWQTEMNALVASFPGFISLEMLPPVVLETQSEWATLQRFNSEENLKQWQHSKERRALLLKARPFLAIPDLEDKVELSSPGSPSQSVTEVFVTRLYPGKHDAYRKWAGQIQRAESKFPGYQGVYIQAPTESQKGHWITMLRFDTPAHLEAWLSSTERQAILKESEPMVQALESHRVTSPFGGWFGQLAKKSGQLPPVWKQTMLVLLVLFPIVMLELRFLSPLLHSLNSAFATFIGNAISVTLVSWPTIPIAIYFLSWWLDPKLTFSSWSNIKGVLILCGCYLLELLLLWRLLE